MKKLLHLLVSNLVCLRELQNTPKRDAQVWYEFTRFWKNWPTLTLRENKNILRFCYLIFSHGFSTIYIQFCLNWTFLGDCSTLFAKNPFATWCQISKQRERPREILDHWDFMKIFHEILRCSALCLSDFIKLSGPRFHERNLMKSQ